MAMRILHVGAISEAPERIGGRKVFCFGPHPDYAYFCCERCREVIVLYDYSTPRRNEFPTLAHDKEHRMSEHDVVCREACVIAKKKAAKRKNDVMLFAKYV